MLVGVIWSGSGRAGKFTPPWMPLESYTPVPLMIDPYAPIISTLEKAKRVLITTHVRPDGDALGSSAALHLGLRKRNIASDVLLLSHLPSKYAFIFKDGQIPHIDAEQGLPESLRLDEYDCFTVVDTGTWSQLPFLEEVVPKWNVPKLVIDHHLTQQDWATQKLVVTEAAAAGEIVAELLSRWPVALDHAIANALYLALVSDTGWFQFSNTRPYTLRLAATLMEVGIDTDQMYQALYQNERAQRVRLQTRALDSLELLAAGKLAVMRVYKKDFEETGAKVQDTENLINIPLQIATVQVAILLTEPIDPGPVRVSLRSKGQVDVAKFAEQFGGGGHARASGLKINASFGEAHDRVVGAMVGQLGGS
jgi:phosphoesterase RecJ-like protein